MALIDDVELYFVT